MTGRMDFEFSFALPRPKRQAVRSGDEPRRILVLGDFSGRGPLGGGGKPIAERRLHAVDLDSFESVLSRLKPRAQIEAAGEGAAPFELELGELDDFHPDALYRRQPLFRSLRAMRERLLDPSTFAAAAAELNPSRSVAESVADRAAAPPAAQEDDASTLERLLGKGSAERPGASPPRPSPAGGIDLTALIRDRVAPYIIPEADPRQEAYVASMDAVIRDQMRALLHDPSFQALESAWRGLRWLVTELELGEELQLFALDLSREELAADLRGASGNLEDSQFYRLVVEQGIGTLGGPAWSLILGDFYFGHSEDDVFLLAALGAIAAQTGAPFLAGAKTEILGCRSLAESPDHTAWSVDDPADLDRWRRLRISPQASSLGLALPRVLLRLPYGQESDAIESFPFEELPGEPDHESFLWGNPAFACALVWGRAMTEGRGAIQPGGQILDGLPAYTYYRDDEKTLKPCAEVLLSERAGQEILARGPMPLLSHRGRNAVSILRCQSLAETPTALIGFEG